MSDILQIRRAAADDIPEIIGLIKEAADWLHDQGTDQWARPWPNRTARDGRIRRGIEAGRTWMVEDDGVLVGTITCGPTGNTDLWTEPERAEPALYISRLIVSRQQAGRGIGANLIHWAGGTRDKDAKWIRVDVWTTNLALHRYYQGQGFTYLRTCPFKHHWEYPSAALFQKPTADADLVAAGNFKEVS
jgi:ribosomal protein S18 acetylase RimI-like enzyme